MPSTDIVTESCLRRKIRYEVTGSPQTTILCHCNNCRRSWDPASWRSDTTWTMYGSKQSSTEICSIGIWTDCSKAITHNYEWAYSQFLQRQRCCVEQYAHSVVSFQLWFTFVHPKQTEPVPMRMESASPRAQWIWDPPQESGCQIWKFVTEIGGSGYHMWKGLRNFDTCISVWERRFNSNKPATLTLERIAENQANNSQDMSKEKNQKSFKRTAGSQPGLIDGTHTVHGREIR